MEIARAVVGLGWQSAHLNVGLGHDEDAEDEQRGCRRPQHGVKYQPGPEENLVLPGGGRPEQEGVGEHQHDAQGDGHRQEVVRTLRKDRNGVAKLCYI